MKFKLLPEELLTLKIRRQRCDGFKCLRSHTPRAGNPPPQSMTSKTVSCEGTTPVRLSNTGALKPSIFTYVKCRLRVPKHSTVINTTKWQRPSVHSTQRYDSCLFPLPNFTQTEKLKCWQIQVGVPGFWDWIIPSFENYSLFSVLEVSKLDF